MKHVVVGSRGERTRALEALTRHRALLDSLELAIRDAHVPPGWDIAQAVADSAVRLAMTTARIDTFMRTERAERGA